MVGCHLIEGRQFGIREPVPYGTSSPHTPPLGLSRTGGFLSALKIAEPTRKRAGCRDLAKAGPATTPATAVDIATLERASPVPFRVPQGTEHHFLQGIGCCRTGRDRDTDAIE